MTTRLLQERIRHLGRVGAFVAEMLDFYGRYHSTTYGWDGSPIHDAVAVAAVVRPGLLETVAVNVEVECASDLCRGRTVVDRWRRTDRVANADVGIAVDVEGFFALLLERLG